MLTLKNGSMGDAGQSPTAIPMARGPGLDLVHVFLDEGLAQVLPQDLA
jgi:hypothetical protein